MIDESNLEYLDQVTDQGITLRSMPLETQTVDDDALSDEELCQAAINRLDAELFAAISGHISA